MKVSSKPGVVQIPPTPPETKAAAPGIATPPAKGLIGVPTPPAAPKAVAVDARLVEAPFDSFMKVRRFEVDVARPGVEGVSTVKVDILNGPGHNCSMAAPLILGADGQPSVVLKAGDTRAARTLRGEDYVKVGMIGGRWDKVGADPQKIGLDEIAEEIGAELVKGGYLSLGDKLVPTMPHESTEADRYFCALVRITSDDKATGDHGGMEVVGLMKPITMSVESAIAAMDDGRVGEGARARVAYQRAFDSIGFVPELGAYVHDLPAALKKRFSTLGLPPPIDPRKLGDAPSTPAGDTPPPTPHAKAAQVDGVAFVAEKSVAISGRATMIDAKTAHLAGAEVVGQPFPNQIYHLGYDRAKLVEFYADPLQGPMVKLEPVERPVLAAKALALDGERSYKDENTALVALDVRDVAIDLGDAKGPAVAALVDQAMGHAKRLGAACDASPGQTDLRYHFFASQVDKPADASGFVKLSDAIRLCRGGEGDAATEALLLRLARDQAWIPSLDMPVARARKLASD